MILVSPEELKSKECGVLLDTQVFYNRVYALGVDEAHLLLGSLLPYCLDWGPEKHSAYQSACPRFRKRHPIWNANPNSDTQAAAVSSFHNSHSLPQIITRNLMYHYGNKNVSLNINDGLCK